MKLKKGDEIIVTQGKDKDRRGKIDRIDSKKQTVLIPGINVYKRHVKKQAEGKPSGIIDFPRALPFMRVQLVCPKCQKPTRVGFIGSDKDKHRICKKCKQMI